MAKLSGEKWDMNKTGTANGYFDYARQAADGQNGRVGGGEIDS